LDKNKTKLTITINDPNNKNKKTKQQLTVQEIIDNLEKNKVPYNNPKKESEKYKSKNYKKILIQALTNAEKVGQAIKILNDPQYNVDPKYNQYYNEFINTLYGRHPFSGGDNTDIENEI
jgi:cobalamin biosynthesis Co2+ chelatase CbiK